jgi:hypothetical protein
MQERTGHLYRQCSIQYRKIGQAYRAVLKNKWTHDSSFGTTITQVAVNVNAKVLHPRASADLHTYGSFTLFQCNGAVVLLCREGFVPDELVTIGMKQATSLRDVRKNIVRSSYKRVAAASLNHTGETVIILAIVSRALGEPVVRVKR